MPGTYLYPGVYVEEIPSGVRPITGVATSDTAFVDFFARGPLDQAVRCNSFGDFERRFGGLDSRSEASYAIQQYYANGGSVAWVVRVAASNAAAAELTLFEAGPPGSGSGPGPSGPLPSGSGPVPSGSGTPTRKESLVVRASSKGAWGNRLQVAVDHLTDSDTTFNLVVREVEVLAPRPSQAGRAPQLRVVQLETFRNLTLDKTASRFADKVVAANSLLIRVQAIASGGRPEATGGDVIGAPTDANFRFLGAERGSEGQDGFLPGSSNWNSTEGKAALLGKQNLKTGLFALEDITPSIFNLLCLPAAAYLNPEPMKDVIAEGQRYCRAKRAFMLVDIPASLDEKADPTQKLETVITFVNDELEVEPNAAVYFPRLQISDALNENRLRTVAASGTLAGVYARTDAETGVWKAPAGTGAGLVGATLDVKLNDAENGQLNPLGINALRVFPIFGEVSWGARTREGADRLASEWKYIPVRRTALFIEESLYQGLTWVVFEPNDEPLWAQIRLNVGAFMHGLFRRGAFQGRTPREAYLVKCDSETTTQNDIDLGIVNILVGFAPLKPAEFVIIRIQQITKPPET
jgi:phage tail sheath protein FI